MLAGISRILFNRPLSRQSAAFIQAQNTLRVELHSNRQFAITNAHDHAVLGFGYYLKTRQKSLASRNNE